MLALSSAKQLTHLLAAVIEDYFQIPAHQNPVSHSTERPKRQRIFDLILNCGPAALRRERVSMSPKLVRPRELEINKTVRRVPVGDLRLPADGNLVNAQRVANQRARPNFRRSLCDFEIQKRRSNALQILWPRKEIKNDVERLRNPLPAQESVSLRQYPSRQLTPTRTNFLPRIPEYRSYPPPVPSRPRAVAMPRDTPHTSTS